MARIDNANDFPDMKALRKVARDRRVREIEGHGLDDGRVFIHLKHGFEFFGYGTGCASVGDAAEIERKMALIVTK